MSAGPSSGNDPASGSGSESIASEPLTRLERKEHRLFKSYAKVIKAGAWGKPAKWAIDPILRRSTERATAELWSRHDAVDNMRSRMPDGEHVSLPAIWLVEVYTPTTLPGIVRRMQRYMNAATGFKQHEDLDSWVSTVRRKPMGAWIQLNWVTTDKTAFFAPDRRVDTIPAGIKYVRLTLIAETPSLAVLVAQFVLEDERASSLNNLVNEDQTTTTSRTSRSAVKILGAQQQKRRVVDDFRASLHKDAEEWLRARFPGFFASRASGTYPSVEVMVTTDSVPWDRQAKRTAANYRAMEIIGLSGPFGYWDCEDVVGLRMNELRPTNGTDSARRRQVTALAARRKDLFEQDRFKTCEDDSDWYVVQRLHDYVPTFASKFAVSAVLDEIESDLAAFRDLTDATMHKSSAKSLDKLRDRLVQVGLDGRIVASEIVEWAASERGFRYNVPEFRFVDHKGDRKELLANTLRRKYQERAKRIIRTETSLRELLETSANLSVAARNLRLQSAVMWLTVISVVAAAVAAWAAVVAIQR